MVPSPLENSRSFQALKGLYQALVPRLQAWWSHSLPGKGAEALARSWNHSRLHSWWLRDVDAVTEKRILSSFIHHLKAVVARPLMNLATRLLSPLNTWERGSRLRAWGREPGLSRLTLRQLGLFLMGGTAGHGGMTAIREGFLPEAYLLHGILFLLGLLCLGSPAPLGSLAENSFFLRSLRRWIAAD